MSLQMQYLREKIDTARTLLGVVETMRGLAAVNIRRAEAAAEQSALYARTVHLALHGVLGQLEPRGGSSASPLASPPASAAATAPVPFPASAMSRATWLLVTTDMGLCGQFNERIVAYAVEQARRYAGGAEDDLFVPGPSALGSGVPNSSAPGSGAPEPSALGSGAPEPSALGSGAPEPSAPEPRVPGRWLVVGLRGLERLEDAGAHVVGRLDAPGSVEAIPGTVAEAVAALQTALGLEPAGWGPGGAATDEFEATRDVVSIVSPGTPGAVPVGGTTGPVFIVHNRPESGSTFHPRHLQLFPLEASRFRNMPEGEAPWRAVPMTAPSPEQMLPRLIREQMYIDLFQAFVESFAAENAARLSSMKNASDNIEELLEELEGRYRQERQDAITTELMELLGGVEAVRRADK